MVCSFSELTASLTSCPTASSVTLTAVCVCTSKSTTMLPDLDGQCMKTEKWREVTKTKQTARQSISTPPPHATHTHTERTRTHALTHTHIYTHTHVHTHTHIKTERERERGGGGMSDKRRDRQRQREGKWVGVMHASSTASTQCSNILFTALATPNPPKQNKTKQQQQQQKPNKQPPLPDHNKI